MKKSPFQLLKEAIENELFDASLRIQNHSEKGEKINSEFCLGYTEALKLMLMKAEYIYRYGGAPKF